MTLNLRIFLVLIGTAACGTDNLTVSPPSPADVGPTLEWQVTGQPAVPQPLIQSGGFAGPNAPAAAPADPIGASRGLSRGGWSDVVQIDVPPGPNGHAPKIAVVANHNARRGILGSGHTLVAGSKIERRGFKGGVPNLKDRVQYFLDGRPLVEVDGVWRLEEHDERGLIFVEADNVWVLETAKGHKRTYGTRATGTPGKPTSTGVNATKLLYRPEGRSVEGGTDQDDPNIDAQFVDCERDNLECNTVTWFVSQDEDGAGNLIKYDYDIAPLGNALDPDSVYWYPDSNHHRLDQIRYDAAVVEFIYENRHDTRIDFSSGAPTFHGTRLKAIKTTREDVFHSRYAFDYRDDATGVHCGGQAETPGQSVLRGIRFLSDPGVGPQKALPIRCYSTNNQTEESWSEPETIPVDDAQNGFDLSAFSGNTGSTDSEWSFTEDRLIPIVANLNYDGRPDLLVVNVHCLTGNGACRVEMDAKVATSSGQFTADPLADRWEAELESRLTGDLFHQGRGYAFVDLDRDGMNEFLWEAADDDNRVLRYDPYRDQFVEAALQVGGQALRGARFVDINGDGHADWLNANDAEFLLNSGSGSYFEEAGVQQTDLWRPVELPTVSIANVPDHLGAKTGEKAKFLREQMKFTDVNGDGVVDIALALFTNWEDQEECSGTACRTRPDPDSVHSRIYWGDGYGQFIDSGLSAGPPTIIETPRGPGSDSRTKSWRVPFSVRDFDRSGVRTLVSAGLPYAGGGSMGLSASRFRNLAEGFQFVEHAFNVEVWNDAGDVDENIIYTLEMPSDAVGGNAGIDLGIDTSGAGDSCHTWGEQQSIADFDGDGFSDIIRIETGSACNGTSVCISIARNERSVSRGRMTSMTGRNGGRTDLTWGFSARPAHPNPTLPSNIEVLSSVDGAAGLVKFRYGYGAFGRGRFGGFALVQRQGLRGGVDQFGFNVSSALAGKPLYKARVRQDGSLERATAFVHGQTDAATGLVIGTGSGYLDGIGSRFNPLQRQCDFEFGRSASGTNAEKIEQLLIDCFGHNRDADQQPSFAQILAASGAWRFPPYTLVPGNEPTVPWQLAQEVWGVGYSPPSSVTLGTFGLANAIGYDMDSLVSEVGEIATRWPIPTGDGLIPPPVPTIASDVDPHTPQEADNADKTMFVRSWTHNASSFRLVITGHDRDVMTDDDNLSTSHSYEPVDGFAIAQRRTRSSTTRMLPGVFVLDPVSSVHLEAFAGGAFALPTTIKRCGKSLANCQTETRTWHTDGMPASRTFAGRTDRWSHNDWCRDLRATNAAGEIAITTRDSSCRTIEKSFLGKTTSFSYDEFGRLEEIVHNPGGGLAIETQTRTRDDDYSIAEDSSFEKPRMAIADGNGRLELVFLDGFGRQTRRDVCQRGSQGGDLGVQCDGQGKRRIEWRGIGTDGTVVADAESFYVGEPTPAHWILRDGLGRERLRRAPSAASTAGDLQWADWKQFRAPTRLFEVSPTGITTESMQTTLTSAVKKAGETSFSEQLDVSGNPTVTIDEGLESSFTYDDLHRLESIARAESALCVNSSDTEVACDYDMSFAHTEAGEVESVTRPDGSRIEWTYDSLGRMTTETLYDGGSVVAEQQSLVYDVTPEGWRTTTRTQRSGARLRTVVDGLGRVVSREHLDYPRGETFSYSDDNRGNRTLTTTTTDGSRADVTTTEYDVFGWPTSTTSPASGTSTFSHNARGQRISSIDADGVQRRWNYKADGSLASAHLGPWETQAFTYRNDGLPQVIQSGGTPRVLSYDNLGRVSRITEGLRGTDLPTRDVSYIGTSDRIDSMKLSPTSSGTSEWQFEYDEWQRLRAVSGPAGDTLTKRDVLGRARISVDGEGYERVTRYDAEGRVSYADGLGRNAVSSSYQYLDSFEPTSAPSVSVAAVLQRTDIDLAGAVQHTWVDGLGRLLATERADGTRLEAEFDGSRRVRTTVLDSGSNLVSETEWSYEPATGRLAGEVGPFGGAAHAVPTTDVAWTDAGRLETIDSSGEVTTREYLHGLLVRENYLGLEKLRRYAAPSEGVGPRLVELRERGSGPVRRTALAYDDLGRLIESQTTSPGQQVLRQLSGYDGFGLAQTMTASTTGNGINDTVQTLREYDAAGRLTQREQIINGASSGETTWDYFANGALKKSVSPSGYRVEYEYGPTFDYELDSISDGNQTLFQVTSRDAAGRPVSVTRPQSTATMTYDPLGRLVGRFESGAVKRSWEGVHDALGQLVWELQTDDANPVGFTNEYTYDGAGRLVRESKGRDGSKFDYVVDAAGKRLATSMTDAAGNETTTSFDYRGELLASVGGVALSYDAWNAVTADQNGNTFQRDATGAVRSVGAGSRIIRDGGNLPVGIVSNEGMEESHWDLNPAQLPIEVTHAGGGATSYVRGFGAAHRSVSGGPLAGQSGVLDYNAAGSVIAEPLSTVDPGSSFGVGSAPKATDPFAFAGMQSIVGLQDVYMARHRFYDAESGRFLSPDPLGLGGGKHRLLYANGNPIKYSDPMGLSAECEDPAGPFVPSIHPMDLSIHIEPVDPPPIESMLDDVSKDWIAALETLDLFGDERPDWAKGSCDYIGCGTPGGGGLQPDHGIDVTGPSTLSYNSTSRDLGFFSRSRTASSDDSNVRKRGGRITREGDNTRTIVDWEITQKRRRFFPRLGRLLARLVKSRRGPQPTTPTHPLDVTNSVPSNVLSQGGLSSSPDLQDRTPEPIVEPSRNELSTRTEVSNDTVVSVPDPVEITIAESLVPGDEPATSNNPHVVPQAQGTESLGDIAKKAASTVWDAGSYAAALAKGTPIGDLPVLNVVGVVDGIRKIAGNDAEGMDYLNLAADVIGTAGSVAGLVGESAAVVFVADLAGAFGLAAAPAVGVLMAADSLDEREFAKAAKLQGRSVAEVKADYAAIGAEQMATQIQLEEPGLRFDASNYVPSALRFWE